MTPSWTNSFGPKSVTALKADPKLWPKAFRLVRISCMTLGPALHRTCWMGLGESQTKTTPRHSSGTEPCTIWGGSWGISFRHGQLLEDTLEELAVGHRKIVPLTVFDRFLADPPRKRAWERRSTPRPNGESALDPPGRFCPN